MIYIILVAIVTYFVLIAWTWQSLGFIEKNKKVGFILVGLILMYILTLITFQLTKSGIEYPNAETQSSIQNVLVAIFTGINGILVMPQIGRIFNKVNEDEMEKAKAQKRILMILILFFICLAFEVGYMKNTQEGILKIYHAMK